MPWKNGNGVTTELAIYPPDATLTKNDFLWRMSSAEISADGDFSLFSDCDRYLSVWKGNGVLLESAQGGQLVQAKELVKFSGKDSIFARLQNGPITDWNFIYKRRIFHADCQNWNQPLNASKWHSFSYDLYSRII